MNFNTLLDLLRQSHELAQQRVAFAISQVLVVRNWLIGFYIVEFEQNGQDYAQYWGRLLNRLSEALSKEGLKGMSYTNLTLYRKFYLVYTHLATAAKPYFLPGTNLQPLAEDLTEWQLPAEKLLRHMSFSHFVELLKVEDPA